MNLNFQNVKQITMLRPQSGIILNGNQGLLNDSD